MLPQDIVTPISSLIDKTAPGTVMYIHVCEYIDSTLKHIG